MKKLIIGILIFIFVSIIFYLDLSRVSMNNLFIPNNDKKATKYLKEKNNMTEISIITKKGKKINGWFMKNGKEKNPLVIYFGGNGECSSKSFKKFNKNEFKDMFQGFNVISIDYPSYGKSEGAISDKTMFDTSKEIYDYAINRNDVDKNKIVIIGYSIGTGVATYLSSERYVKGLVLISPYDSGYSIYNSKLNIFYGPMKIFVKYKFDSIKYAKKINIRPLIIVSKDDKIISYKLAENLSKYFKAGNEFILLKGFNHNFYWSKSIVRDKIKEYIKSII